MQCGEGDETKHGGRKQESGDSGMQRGNSGRGSFATDGEALQDVKDRSMGSPAKKCTD